MACAGDSTQICGGGNHISVFHDTPPVANRSAPVTTTCVEKSTKSNFTLRAEFRDGSPPVYLLVTHITSSTAVITVRRLPPS